MLSHSVDPYKRDNERCTPLYEETRINSNSESRSDWNPYQNINNYYPYRPRSGRSVTQKEPETNDSSKKIGRGRRKQLKRKKQGLKKNQRKNGRNKKKEGQKLLKEFDEYSSRKRRHSNKVDLHNKNFEVETLPLEDTYVYNIYK